MEIGLRELRQQASELVRRVEQGESLVVTVSGRPAARLVPVEPRTWRRTDELAALYESAADPSWDLDRDALDAGPRDPWSS